MKGRDYIYRIIAESTTVFKGIFLLPKLQINLAKYIFHPRKRSIGCIELSTKKKLVMKYIACLVGQCVFKRPHVILWTNCAKNTSLFFVLFLSQHTSPQCNLQTCFCKQGLHSEHQLQWSMQANMVHEIKKHHL